MTTSDRIDRIQRFHAGIYRDAFPDQAEPLANWIDALRGEAAYDFFIDLADDDSAGITYERYRASGCGLLTYLAVAPSARARGVGRALLERAIERLGAPIVFGEVNDPRRTDEPAAWPRLVRFQRWGARVLDIQYIQPSLGPGLPRDRGLVLIAFSIADVLDGGLVRAFLREFYELTERREPDAELTAILAAIPERVSLLSLDLG